MGHLIDLIFTVAVAGQAVRGLRWAWRRYLLRRAPMRQDLMDAIDWSRLHRGDLARFPDGDVSMYVRGSDAKLVVNRQIGRHGLG